MKKQGIIIKRNQTAINKLIAHLLVRCAIANNALEKLINADAVCVEINDELAKDIALSDSTRLMQAIRIQVESEAGQKLKIVRDNYIGAQMGAIAEKINAIFSEKAEEERRNANKLYDRSGETYNWPDYIRYDGEKITFDAEAVEKDNTTEIPDNSKAADYLKMAERLCKQMSEFVYITKILGNNTADAVNTDGDCIINIRGGVVSLDTRKIDWLSFDNYDQVVSDAKAVAAFEKVCVNE